MYISAGRFTGNKPISFARGRYGDLFAVQGHGVRPLRWDGISSYGEDAGMDPPLLPPSVEVTGVVQYYVARVDVTEPGDSYSLPPSVTFSGSAARSAKAMAYLTGGSISRVLVSDGGRGYTSPPTATVTGSATLYPVTRPHLRGEYDCYYRYIDDTPSERGGPIPSNLSPVRTISIDVGAGAIAWGQLSSNAPTRATLVELWRTTSFQATTVYRVATINLNSTYIDSYTDAELTDPDRTGYAAMPILKPNGELNAYRFVAPPTDKAVVVSFQDRMWYAVDTGGKEPNSLYYSETDEPESVPDVNEIIVQENVRDTDAITALVPFGAALMVMQRRHVYRVTFAKQPIIDAAVNLAGYRGCLNQRCWDLHDGIAYVLDQFGVYAMDPSGSIKPISEGIANYFRHYVDYTHAQWFAVRFDARVQVLRVFLSLKGDGDSVAPVRVLCYSPTLEAWWEERYPRPITAAAGITLDSGQYRVLYASSKARVYSLDEGWVDVADGSISSVVVTDGGAGYLSPPTICVAGGHGAWLDAYLNDRGQVQGVSVRMPGFGYASTDAVTFAPPDDPRHPSPRTATGFLVTHSQDASLPTDYVFRSASYEIATDEQRPRQQRADDRTISVVYKPTECDSDMELRTYFNASASPRPNAVSRDRGVGFAHESQFPAAVVNLRRERTNRGEATGVERARFGSVSTVDPAGSDRHLAVELSGRRGNSGDVVIHQIDVEGIAT